LPKVLNQGSNLNETTDEHLIQAVAGGNLEAFNKLVQRYQAPAWRTAYRFLGDRMEAEDIAQETFLKVLEAAPRYRPTATFRTYFYRILTNLCIDRTRKKHPTVDIDDIPETPDSSFNPSESLIEKERGAQIRTVLDSLPAKQKAAMILKHYEELSYAEIARILGLTPKAVERLISRARSSLHARLNHP
jgi:RNA polymerase sigma-70 factor (ECF subfamily)